MGTDILRPMGSQVRGDTWMVSLRANSEATLASRPSRILPHHLRDEYADEARYWEPPPRGFKRQKIWNARQSQPMSVSG